MNRSTSALAALSADEKAIVLDGLLTARPDLRELAEAQAVRLMSTEDRAAVTDAVAGTMRCLDIEELNGRAGRRVPAWSGLCPSGRGRGRDRGRSAGALLRELERRAALGMTTAAVELAVGILLGLYECRDGGSETLLEYCPDYAAERAGNVVDQCARLGIDLPRTELLNLLPDWDGILC